ncbi:zinc finger protein RFP-like [Bombina bombina]|uniref:zinc finger protein RFP-like n=1 Tax=Bombina bombina TaxID=8345 RepID=UPI00235B217B|nr:zinc finger protein RFP-like [Bombina bombina]
MASADLREELTCPICFSIYTDPVTLSCGHNFCLGCIESVLGTQEGSGVYTCPECRKSFRSESKEHILTEPTTSWGNKKCTEHKKLLEYYCTEDGACICVSCSLAGEHRGHQVELLNEASEKKKEKLRDVLQKLTTKREKTEKSLQEHRRGVQEKAAGVTEQLLNQIRHLEKEKDELTRKMSHIEELCNMTDPLTVLQEQESHRDDFCGAEKGDNEVTQRDKQVPAGGALDEGLISGSLYRNVADIMHDVKRERYMQVTSDILLDIDTAGNSVIVSGDMKTASWSRIDQQRPVTPERFTSTVPQVLSTNSFSSGQHYWEVQISKSGIWRVGVCYPSMVRGESCALMGNNNKSWCLRCCYKHLSVLHNTRDTLLPYRLSCDTVGILLDYEAGRLTFCELCDPIRHLHTVTVTFTEPLHAAFSVCDAWVRILR